MEREFRCKICESPLNSAESIEVRENMFGLDEKFNYYLCPACGCLQIESLPENIGKYYPDDYYAFSKQKVDTGRLKKLLYELRSRIAQSSAYKILKLIKHPHILKLIHYGEIKFGYKILDVGCGSGSLLQDFSNYGFRNLTGIDPFINESFMNESLKIYRKNIFEIEGKFDIIIFNHSYEHIWEQNSVLERSKELLSEHGLLILRLPVLNYAFDEYRENWIQIDAPRHFFLHTSKSLSLICEKHGLKFEYVFFDSDEYQFWGSEQCKKGINLTSENSYKVNPEKSIFSKKDIIAYSKKASRLNKRSLGDQATFLIRRAN